MKRIVSMLILMLLLFLLCSCTEMQQGFFHKEPSVFEEAMLSTDEISSYSYGFEEYFSQEEYVELIQNLRNKNENASLMPIRVLNEELYFVQKEISTYDKQEVSVAIFNVGGGRVTKWRTDWEARDIQYDAECGEYFFIKTKEDAYGISACDVINQKGQTIAKIENIRDTRYYIGEGYVFFSLGSDFGNIMNDKGEVIELQYKSVRPSYGTKPTGALDEDQEIGKISEGLFYGFSKGNINTVAYYYNMEGKVAIDLSTQKVNYEVTKLHDFSNGQAKIEFIGANGKKYEASIDKKGEFVEGPFQVQ